MYEGREGVKWELGLALFWTGKMGFTHCAGGPSSRCEESLFFFIFMRTFRDIVTAVVYCYITTEFHYAKRDSGLLEGLCYNGLNLQRFVWEKTFIEILAEILIFLQ